MLKESYFFRQRDDAPMLGFKRVNFQGSSSGSMLSDRTSVLYVHVCPSGEPLTPERLHHCGCLPDFSQWKNIQVVVLYAWHVVDLLGGATRIGR